MDSESSVFRIGDLRCRIVTDGVNHYPRPMLLGDLPPHLETYVDPLLDDQGRVRVPYNCLLVQTGDATVLIDTGGGAELGALWGTPVGRLQESLAAAGVGVDDVTHVLLTHAHPDHVGGLTVPGADPARRMPVFAHARHYISRTEHDFWMRGDHTGEHPPYAELAPLARMHLAPLAERGLLERVEPEFEPVPGVRLVAAPGHTPGHLAVLLTSGARRLTFAADALVFAGQAEQPEWTLPLDVMPETTVRTRRRLLRELQESGGLLVLFHVGGVLRVEGAGSNYRLVPASDGTDRPEPD